MPKRRSLRADLGNFGQRRFGGGAPLAIGQNDPNPPARQLQSGVATKTTASASHEGHLRFSSITVPQPMTPP